jgi:hypothetical protein
MESELEYVILVLSVNIATLLAICGKLLMYNRKNSGLSIEHCDTPC